MATHRWFIRRIAVAIGIFAGIAATGFLALWWRLASGPIQLDVVTPWLASAIEENFGSNHHVEVGGTQIERTEDGGMAVRIRNIVVRDADGAVVASAPKAEVHLSGLSLLSGHIRAESLSLVGAAMAVRIERDGGVTVFAGADKRPIATASVPITAAAALLRTAQENRRALTGPASAASGAGSAAALSTASDQQVGAARRARDAFAAFLSWIDGIGKTGLDGHDLRELGLKNGNLSVDDERTGKHWTFEDISLSAQRVHGGLELTLGSDNPQRPWTLKAAVTATRQGYRRVQLEAHRVAVADLLLAARLGQGNLQIDMPVSASVSGEIGPDGLPQTISGRIIADAGSIGDANADDGNIAIDRADFKLNWDAGSRILSVPFQILSAGNRITLLGQIQIPEQTGGAWLFRVGGGTVVLSSPGASTEPLVLNRIAVGGRYDAAKQRLVIEEGDIGNTDVGVAMSGTLDFSGGAHLAAGLAGTRMPVEALKRLWPAFVVPKVRDWFTEHLISGTVERIVIAVNSPIENLKASGPPVADDGLTVDVLGTGCVIRPVQGLPALRDADLNVHIVGRDAIIALGKATTDLPSGRRLVVSGGVFEVPDTAPRAPPARVHFKVDGPVPAAAELLRMDRLREFSEGMFEPSSMHGMLSAQVTLGMPVAADLPPGSISYAVMIDATNFAAEHMIMGQRVEAALLKASATPQGFQLKGDIKIGGTPAALEYRKLHGEPDAEIRLGGVLDEAARNNLGFALGEAVSGPIPVRLAGRVATISDREGQFTVEADLTPARVDGLLPGWAKPAGKPAHATFTVSTTPQSTRVDNLLIEGAGGTVKGVIEFNASGEVQTANFPVYGFSDADRASLRIERSADGPLRVSLRGQMYDGRSFIKTVAGVGPATPTAKRHLVDVDLEVKLGAVVGFNGETLRSLDLKLSRRAGEIRSFGLTAKIGRDATLAGELRGRASGRQMVYLESSDAAAFFRFTDVYSRITGGQMSLAMEAPSAEDPAQRGTLYVRNFTIHDEAQLERAVSSGNEARRNGNAIAFANMRVEFTRMPGRVALRDGVVRGPLLGGTIDGLVDYARDEVHLRGTLVPLYGANNLLAQLPLVGLFLGGEKEGLVGITYEVVGRPGNPALRINPISALAPGILRKVFEFPANSTGGGSEQVPHYR